MACERNRIIELKEYLLSLGISVNIGKNKARGHKGVFMHRFNDCRIDISNDVPPECILSVILHEFAHYIHYYYDKNLKSLDFIFGKYDDEIKEELIKITVQEVPKDFASALYSTKQDLNTQIKEMVRQLKVYCPEFKLSEKNKFLEKNISYPLKYLLKYDRVKFAERVYSVEKLDEYKLSAEEVLYLQIKSKQRAIRRINTRISKLNRYYNHPTELFARFLDAYYTNREYTEKTAPKACSAVFRSENPYIEKLNNILT